LLHVTYFARRVELQRSLSFFFVLSASRSHQRAISTLRAALHLCRRRVCFRSVESVTGKQSWQPTRLPSPRAPTPPRGSGNDQSRPASQRPPPLSRWTTRRRRVQRLAYSATVFVIERIDANGCSLVQPKPILQVLNEWEFVIAPVIFTALALFTRLYKIGISNIVTWDEAQFVLPTLLMDASRAIDLAMQLWKIWQPLYQA
jgi:hypothetical protein